MSWFTDLFKRRKADPVRTEIIYRNELTVGDLFIGPGRYGCLPIVTYVVKTVDARGRVDYKIKQDLPLSGNPFFDGDFATNRAIERYGHSEWILAEEAIDKDKSESLSKTEEP